MMQLIFIAINYEIPMETQQLIKNQISQEHKMEDHDIKMRRELQKETTNKCKNQPNNTRQHAIK